MRRGIESKLGGAFECAQKVRHDPGFVPTANLDEWKMSCVSLTQRAGEPVVVFPQTYHQGWTKTSSLAEAINYAPIGWTAQGYRECKRTCPGYPIPNARMAFLNSGEEQFEASALVGADPAGPGVDGNKEMESRKEVVRRIATATRKGEVIDTTETRSLGESRF